WRPQSFLSSFALLPSPRVFSFPLLHATSYLSLFFFFLLLPRPPSSTLFPYTTLFRSIGPEVIAAALGPIEKAADKHGVRLDLERSEEHTSELQSRGHLVCRLLLEKKKTDLPVRGSAVALLRHVPAYSLRGRRLDDHSL